MKILVLQDIKHVTYQNFKENFRLLLYVLVILYLSRVVLHECKSSRDKNKTSARQTSLTDRQLKVHLIHIWYWYILPSVYFLTAFPKSAHHDNKDFPPVFFESFWI